MNSIKSQTEALRDASLSVLSNLPLVTDSAVSDHVLQLHLAFLALGYDKAYAFQASASALS